MSNNLKLVHVGETTEFCEHLHGLATYLRTHRLEVSACGECGTPWVQCEQCGLDYEFRGESVTEAVNPLA